MAILNDGTKAYDVGKDGAGQEAGRCSLDFRRTEVTAKGKLTYFKNHFLEVGTPFVTCLAEADRMLV